VTACTSVQVTLKLFASLVDHLPPEARNARRWPMTLPAGTTVGDVIEQKSLPPKLCHLVLVNGIYVPPADRATRELRDHDELAIWPPIAGG
jgi:sulfur carrier protein ThiS